MLVTPVTLAVIILAVVAKHGIGVFKKQGVAWGLTVLMIFAAVGIGYARTPANNPSPEPGLQQGPGTYPSYVWDDAHVLSNQEIRVLDARNDRLWERHNVSIGVVTCEYSEVDLGQYAQECAQAMGLGGYDMIVALDILGKNYWLLQGEDLRPEFTDDDCANYAYEYMEYNFARGFYGDAVLQLTEMLEAWYGSHYG